MMSATEQLLSDWLKEDIMIVSHDFVDNIAFCLEKYVFKAKLVQCVEYVGQRILL